MYTYGKFAPSSIARVAILLILETVIDVIWEIDWSDVGAGTRR